MTPGRFRVVCRRLPEILSALSILALLVRLTIRDWIPGIAAFYYATPVPVIALGTAAAALAAFVQRRFR